MVDGTPASSVADIVKEASEFGGLVIPPDAKVLDARTDRGIDTSYRIALSTDSAGVNALLTGSGITPPLTRTYHVTVEIIAGPPLATSPSLLETGDRYQRPDGKHVSRDITVDERDQTTRYVHIQLFDT
ncbi:hypothetical protein [Nocardia stercoris]|nr:hypothetical protein [Nocardia stercoris]